MARAQFDIARLLSTCAIALFLDVKTAFASMIRALAIPYDAPDSVFLERLSQWGFKKEEVMQIFVELQDPDFFIQAYGSSHAVHIFKSVCDFAWVSLEGVPGVLRPRCGTLAGTSWAD
eukprot:1881058-Karenia_brevis.AAC.1